MAFHVFLFLLLFFLMLSLAQLCHLYMLHHCLPHSRARAVHSMVHRLRHHPHPTRLSGLSPFLHLLSGCGAIASARAALARGEKPAGSPETQRHPRLRLPQPAVPVLRDHRRSRLCASLVMAPMVPLNRSRPFAARPAAPRSVLAEGLGPSEARRVFGYRHATITTRTTRAGEHAQTLHEIAISGSRTSKWTNCAQGFAATNRCCGAGWQVVPAPSFFPCSIWVPARKRWRTCSSTPCGRSVPDARPVFVPLQTGSVCVTLNTSTPV